MAESIATAEPVFNIPTHCKAGIVHNEGPDFTVTVESVPVPTPGPNDLLVKLNCTGICYSDIHFMLNDIGAPKMSELGVHSPGHEGAGVVVKVGENVKNFKVGDRAGIKPLMDVCQNCETCWAGKENYCQQATHTGIMVAGTYQQYLVSPAKYTTRIPDGVPDDIAAPIMCSASTMMRSLTDSGLAPGQWAAFPGGAGGVGCQGVQLARALGLRPIVIDTGADKEAFSLKHGAEHFIDFKTVENVAEKVKSITDGIGAHGVFVTAPSAYANAIDLVGDRIGGVVMCIGIPPKGSTAISAEPGWFIGRNRKISGTLVGTMEDTRKALEFAERGMLVQIAEVLPIDRLPEAVDRLRKGLVAGRMVVDFNA